MKEGRKPECPEKTPGDELQKMRRVPIITEIFWLSLMCPSFKTSKQRCTSLWNLYLSAHLKRTGISDTSLCECGQADQTPDHVLQSCPKYAERRLLTWPQGADLTTKLWGSAEDLYRTAAFVASTVLKI